MEKPGEETKRIVIKTIAITEVDRVIAADFSMKRNPFEENEWLIESL